MPLIAGISFEIIKFAGKQPPPRLGAARSCAPGLQLQKLTTREPDLDQLAVAIAAMKAVLAVENPMGRRRTGWSGVGSWSVGRLKHGDGAQPRPRTLELVA